jgi:acyl carrier protein
VRQRERVTILSATSGDTHPAARSLAPGAAPVVHNRGGRRNSGGPGETVSGGSIVTSVEERVIEIVCENLGVNREQVTRQTSFQEDVGADSLDIVELVMELEEEFEITIPEEHADKIKTVGEAIDYIEREQAKK